MTIIDRPTQAAPVPFVDLAWQHAQVATEVEAGIAQVIAECSFVGGPHVAHFEAVFADHCGAAHCAAVGNGTDAIELALRAEGVGAGDEVLVAANTFVATVEAITRAGAQPVLVDCDPAHLLIDPVQVERRIAPHTRAVVPTHLYGQMAPMEDLVAAIGDHRACLISDAAQSQGATRFGHGMAWHAVAAATSFYPGKNLGAYGDGGAVVTDDAEISEAVRRLRNHGGTTRYAHDVVGTNSRLDTIQAVVLTAKLSHLSHWNALRRAAADRYRELLGGCEAIGLPEVADGNVHVWHLYVVQVDDRDRVVDELAANGIGAGIHYPAPVHLTPAFAHLATGRGSFPVAERAAERIVSLPMHPGITADQQERVAEVLLRAVGSRP